MADCSLSDWSDGNKTHSKSGSRKKQLRKCHSSLKVTCLIVAMCSFIDMDIRCILISLKKKTGTSFC
jgi:hypothetical protein